MMKSDRLSVVPFMSRGLLHENPRIRALGFHPNRNMILS
jgi:hypothetical protein